MSGNALSGRQPRSVARLAAVQALYQMEAAGIGVEGVVREFSDHRFGGDIEGSVLAEADEAFFAEVVRGVFAGISPAAAGLVIATAIKMAAPLWPRPIAVGFGLAAFGAVGVLRWPMIEVLAVLAPLSVLAAWVRRR